MPVERWQHLAMGLKMWTFREKQHATVFISDDKHLKQNNLLVYIDLLFYSC